MSERKITVELTEAEARKIVADHYGDECHLYAPLVAKVMAALPIEWADGTVAWVTDESGCRCIAVRFGGEWREREEEYGSVVVLNHEATKVEPLRVAGPDELIVKRPMWLDPSDEQIPAADLRGSIKRLGVTGHYPIRAACNAVADALEAEERAQ